MKSFGLGWGRKTIGCVRLGFRARVDESEIAGEVGEGKMGSWLEFEGPICPVSVLVEQIKGLERIGTTTLELDGLPE